ncbi:MAG TPA: energy transducer TonB [Longimicrobiales bacterium]|nr:energy transducer TonB [Longimicrobiales bacterium]
MNPSTSFLATETANDRMKRSWDNWFWGSMIAAIVLHFSVFQFWPDMTADDVSFASNELEAIELPPEIEIPPPPEAIQRPATPVIAEAEISEDITIAPTTFEDNPVEDLPPPPDNSGEGDIGANPTFTPYTVAPDITNRTAVIRALEREYPPLLRDAGIGGTANIWFFIDENGRVQDTRIQESSGHAQLDDAALRVADIMEFTPALNRDKKVPVWVAFPITFQVR